ncbi:cofilin-2-like [Hypanus sabinus]|uniref:cofilin-2-like n=1 Tax=Hypanus sabinus TaxID=79690 RepID=UPI0028C414C6|nr:cofilin-2-like [Hypanus sabinus]
MASGVKVCDSVVNCFNQMKVRKVCSKEESMKRKKVVLLKLNDSDEFVVLDEQNEILVGDVVEGTVKDPLNSFVSMLPKDRCCYALFDVSFETSESKKEELVLIHWNPEGASIKEKMLYASSKDALMRKFGGIKHKWQFGEMEEVIDVNTWAEKLGPSVLAVESRKVTVTMQQQSVKCH